MSGSTLLVIADPAAPFLKSLARVPEEVRTIISTIVSNDPARLKQIAPEADAILFAEGRGGLLNAILPLAKNVRWIHSLWTGVESLITPELAAHPAPLTNGRGVFRWPLADWVMAAMLHYSFDLRRVIRQQEAGVWEPFTSSVLTGKTLGIVGYGAIGSAAAERARPFGMKIAALRRRPELSDGDALVDVSYAPAQLNQLIAASDYVLVVLPSTAGTRGLIGEAQIAAMKSTAVLINIGRGASIEEAALLRALESGKIRGAALDVFTTEPLPSGHPFYKLPNVLLSPHTADRVEGFLQPAVDCFFENLKRFLKGEPLLNVVDKHAGY
jgi:phosphoglycerate dehydrogenase-like enzyme